MKILSLLATKGHDFVKELVRQAKTRYFWKDLLVVFIGILIYSIGYFSFIYPQRITTGGLSGASILITLSTGIDYSVPYISVTIALLIIAFIMLDNGFFIKTLVGSSFLMILVPIASVWAVPDPKIEAMWQLKILADQPALALAIGSVLTGLGLGLVFSVNGSTGGTDIIVALVNKYKNMSLGRALMITDGTIVLMSYFVNVYLAVNKMDPSMALETLVYSILNVLIVSITLDAYISSNRQSMQFMIFSNKYQEINEAITKRLKRGCTILEATGGFSGKPAKVLLVVVRKRNSVALGRMIQEIDPNAFISQAAVKGVYGEGFDSVKTLK